MSGIFGVISKGNCVHTLLHGTDYHSHLSPQYARTVDWIAKDLGVTTLRHQIVGDMVKAAGLLRERLCLHCWTGQCPKAARPKAEFDIVETKETSHKKKDVEADHSKLW